MFGIIIGTFCLIALIATIRRERYFRRHGYPEGPYGYHGCAGGCGYGHGYYGRHHHHWHPGMPPHEPPAAPPAAQGTTTTEGSSS